jgi:hypothetical protein
MVNSTNKDEEKGYDQSFDNVYELIKESCKEKYRYLKDDKDQPYDTVSNKGLKAFEVSYVLRNGEYHGFSVEAQEDIPHIITDHHIINALKHIQLHEFESAALQLDITAIYNSHGVNSLYYLIDEWLKINGVDPLFNPDIDKNEDYVKQLNRYVRIQRHHPINGKIKIIDIGTNTKTKESVVPPEWMGRVFDNASELHKEMDNLPCRKGKPPVSYCCIYSNSIKRQLIWLTDKLLTTGDILYSVRLNNKNIIYSTKTIVTNSYTSTNLVIQINDICGKKNNCYVEVSDDLLDRSAKRIKTKNIGYLSSLLQKCFRRGKENTNILEKTLIDLNNSPTYNLPDHNFATVSGARQLLWRTYISIVEDVKGYFVDVDSPLSQNSIDMQSLVLLSIVFQKDSNLKLSSSALNIISKTCTTLQSYNDVWNWRVCEEIDPTDPKNIIDDTDLHRVTNSIRLAVMNMHSVLC